ncbi:TPM domain-containing protein [Campylobacter sp. RM16190]|uniref:TPM domain-containing protein n=1 Tax=Campylobacter sp. RM16190 TaxID=1705727 RepID=UPI001B8BCEA0|nr:TPM domain-containing protein [Campylobacter sp. RM16190]
MKKILTLLFISVTIFAADIKFPELTGRVVDEAGILKQETKDKLTEILANHEKNTTNQVVVVTVNSLQGQDIESYSLKLGRHWGIGQKDKNNGVLLVVAPNEREVRIEVGYGLEGSLTDATASSIIQRIIVPKFKNSDVDQGVLQATYKILDFIDNDANNNYVTDPMEDMFFTLFASMVGGSLILVFISKLIKYRIVSDIATSVLVSSLLGFFIGVLVSAFTGSVMLSIIVAAVVTVAIFIFVFNSIRKMPRGLLKSGGYAGGSSGGFSGGSRGGGFSGGGGSFGGGGASGRW